MARRAAAASATACGAAGVGGGEAENNSGYALFEVEITLTAAGLYAGPGLGLAAVSLLFQYLQMLEAAGPQEWVWRESKLISDCKFRCDPTCITMHGHSRSASRGSHMRWRTVLDVWMDSATGQVQCGSPDHWCGYWGRHHTDVRATTDMVMAS